MEKFRDLGQSELEAQQRELTEQVFRLRFQMNTGQSEGLKKLREAKRDLGHLVVGGFLRQQNDGFGELRPVPAGRDIVGAHPHCVGSNLL
jgi:ribosomal protein L29